jgi:hypothetical protein
MAQKGNTISLTSSDSGFSDDYHRVVSTVRCAQILVCAFIILPDEAVKQVSELVFPALFEVNREIERTVFLQLHGMSLCIPIIEFPYEVYGSC